MKKMYQETSKDAYLDTLPITPGHHDIIMDVLNQKGQASNMEIADALGWSINRVTPRIFELRTKGEVIAATKRICRITGRRVIVWRPNI